jgi:muramoyltetrapeptide carboxypeptidase
VKALAAALFPQEAPDIVFHPQCFLSSGHFAGDDATRAKAFLEVANDPGFDALWLARGGYGSCRLALDVIPQLKTVARLKTYLGYSDAGFLFAGMYKAGFSGLAHGPMPADLARAGGEAAIKRALEFMVRRAAGTLEPSLADGTPAAAFNITILSHLIGTPLEPDLSGHVLMLEEVAEAMYRIDRALFHITNAPGMRRVAGIRLGRCSAIPPNEPDFGMSEEEVVAHWCRVSGIPYLGRADIGHDGENKVVPLGRMGAAARLS